ncbi:MAG: hypothetical protein IKN64_11145 [Desulfovibrio sp.]|nr:hypothetical protein [Desulfovibrio sp.]
MRRVLCWQSVISRLRDNAFYALEKGAAENFLGEARIQFHNILILLNKHENPTEKNFSAVFCLPAKKKGSPKAALKNLMRACTGSGHLVWL